MGEEQDKLGEEEIKNGFMTGGWVVLQNCHLDLDFMAKMEDILNPKNVVPHEDFRLWITCEPHGDFPLGLLQMGIKVANEPPKGLKQECTEPSPLRLMEISWKRSIQESNGEL